MQNNYKVKIWWTGGLLLILGILALVTVNIEFPPPPVGDVPFPTLLVFYSIQLALIALGPLSSFVLFMMYSSLPELLTGVLPGLAAAAGWIVIFRTETLSPAFLAIPVIIWIGVGAFSSTLLIGSGV